MVRAMSGGIGHDGSTGSKLCELTRRVKRKCLIRLQLRTYFDYIPAQMVRCGSATGAGRAFGRVASDGTVTKFAAPDGLECVRDNIYW